MGPQNYRAEYQIVLVDGQLIWETDANAQSFIQRQQVVIPPFIEAFDQMSRTGLTHVTNIFFVDIANVMANQALVYNQRINCTVLELQTLIMRFAREHADLAQYIRMHDLAMGIYEHITYTLNAIAGQTTPYGPEPANQHLGTVQIAYAQTTQWVYEMDYMINHAFDKKPVVYMENTPSNIAEINNLIAYNDFANYILENNIT